MYVIVALGIPTGPIQPCSFVDGSASEFKKTINCLIKKFSKDFPGMAEDWRRFQRNYVPDNDDVYDYIAKHPDTYHIPFKKELFGIEDDMMDDDCGEGLQRQTFYKQLVTKDTQFQAKKGNFNAEEHLYLAQPSMTFDSKKSTSSGRPYQRVKRIPSADGHSGATGIICSNLNASEILLYLLVVCVVYMLLYSRC